jgi:glycosyltransferase involved in cell wall biosynthesis
MPTLPLVTIAIPACNARQTIEETIRSARSQTWPRLEIIVVTDGSTDATYAIAKRMMSRNVKVIRQENGGASAARNTALTHARGDYIQWLDADDLLNPEKISEQLRQAEGGTTSRVLLSSAFGTFAYRPEKAMFTPQALWQDLTPVEFLIHRFTRNLWMNPGVWLVSRRRECRPSLPRKKYR